MAPSKSPRPRAPRGEESGGNQYNSLPEVVRAPRIMTTEQVAEILGLSVPWLKIARSKGKGPPYFKLGTGTKAPVRYDVGALYMWLERNLKVPGGDFETARLIKRLSWHDIEEHNARVAAYRAEIKASRAKLKAKHGDLRSEPARSEMAKLKAAAVKRKEQKERKP